MKLELCEGKWRVRKQLGCLADPSAQGSKFLLLLFIRKKMLEGWGQGSSCQLVPAALWEHLEDFITGICLVTLFIFQTIWHFQRLAAWKACPPDAVSLNTDFHVVTLCPLLKLWAQTRSLANHTHGFPQRAEKPVFCESTAPGWKYLKAPPTAKKHFLLFSLVLLYLLNVLPDAFFYVRTNIYIKLLEWISHSLSLFLLTDNDFLQPLALWCFGASKYYSLGTGEVALWLSMLDVFQKIGV